MDPSQPTQPKLKQTKQDHTNVTKIKASPSLSVCPILSTYKLKFPNRTYKLDQTKITINGFGMAKSAAQLLYGPVLVSFSSFSTSKLYQHFLMFYNKKEEKEKMSQTLN